MKRSSLLFLFLYFFVSFPVSARLLNDLEKTPPLHWAPPAVTVFTLENGLKVYALEDHELPRVEMAVYVRAGESDVSLYRKGLASFTATALVEAGTKNRSPEEVDTWLDERAQNLGSSSGQELTAVFLNGLSEHWKEGFSFLWEVLFEPAFDSKRISIVKKQALDILKREMDLPEPLGHRAFLETLYGPKSLWGSQVTLPSLKKIKRKDLIQFHQQYFGLHNMVFAITGDFSIAELKQELETLTAGLRVGTVNKKTWGEIPLESPAKEHRVHKKVNQAVIQVGGLALPRHSPDLYAYDLIQYILGGSGFSSRLTQDIRTRRGLAYSVYSYWMENPERGYFKISASTRLEKTDEVLQQIRVHLEKMSKGDITAAELKEAQQAILNQYVFQYSTPFKIVAGKLRYDLLGYEENYLQKYPERIRKVTVKVVNAVASKVLNPNALTTVVVGP